MTEQTGPTTVR